MFTLPEELPATVAELDELRGQAQAQINVIQARHAAGEDLSREDVESLRGLLTAVETIDASRAEAAAAEEAHAADVAELLGRAAGPAEDTEETVDGGGESGPVADTVEVEATTEEPAAAAVAASAERRPVNFNSIGTVDAPAQPEGPGWEMDPSAPGYRPGGGRVGFRELALGIDSVRPGSKKVYPNKNVPGNYNAQVIARLQRDVPLIENSHALVAAIEKATDQTQLPGGSLTAAGGWCAPSEQLYNFCDVPDAVDLISLPEITINRGGIRWPVEPDLTAIYDSFQFFFTEPELQAVDGQGVPTAFKNCVEIPCPPDFEEIRLNAVGYCVEAGILQTQGWPELIEWFMRSLAAEHLRAISRRTVLDIVNGSGTPKAISSSGLAQLGASGAILNSLALQAVNLRLNKGLSRTATIEGVAPSWFAEVLRADMALHQDMDSKSVSDAQIATWLADRNIALQYVGDWQTRDTTLPGNLATVAWPGHVDVLLYPAGTWFRSMSNVIELGVFYPKEQLQINRYTRFFTEDAIAVGKRCNQSINVRIPLRIDGSIGARVAVSYSDTTPSSGVPLSGAPIPSGAADPVTKTLTISGSPTGGTYTLTYDGKTTTGIAYNANAATIKAALVALNDGYVSGDFTVTGTGPFSITTPGATLTASGTGLTGGTSPAATIS